MVSQVPGLCPGLSAQGPYRISYTTSCTVSGAPLPHGRSTYFAAQHSSEYRPLEIDTA